MHFLAIFTFRNPNSFSQWIDRLILCVWQGQKKCNHFKIYPGLIHNKPLLSRRREVTVTLLSNSYKFQHSFSLSFYPLWAVSLNCTFRQTEDEFHYTSVCTHICGFLNSVYLICEINFHVFHLCFGPCKPVWCFFSIIHPHPSFFQLSVRHMPSSLIMLFFFSIFVIQMCLTFCWVIGFI